MFILNGKHLCDTIISGNTDLIGVNIPEIRDSFPFSLQIFDAKYSIW